MSNLAKRSDTLFDRNRYLHCKRLYYQNIIEFVCVCFFYKQNFYKERQAGIGKKLAKAKQHPEAELLTKMSKKQVFQSQETDHINKT